MIIAGFPIVLGAVMVAAGAINFAGLLSVRQSFARWRYPAGFNRVTGCLKIAASGLLLVPATSRAGAIAGAVVLLAAVAALVRFREWKHLCQERCS